MELGAPGAFSRPGDLIRDFWAWAELTPGEPISPSGSWGSGYESPGALRSTNADEKNMAMYFPEEEEEHDIGKVDDETLVMIFQWSSHSDADRFKHPLQKSYGQNGQDVSGDTWDRHVAHPVRQLQGVGAHVDMFKLELRGVEDRIEIRKGPPLATRERSGSKRLSIMATGIGERVSGLWR